jgi:hypothetical protein
MRLWRWLFRRRAPKSAKPSFKSPYRMAADKLPGAPPPSEPSPPLAPPAPHVTPRPAQSAPSGTSVFAVVAGSLSLLASLRSSPPPYHPQPLPLPMKMAVLEPPAWSGPSWTDSPWTRDQRTTHTPAAGFQPRWNAPIWENSCFRGDQSNTLPPATRAKSVLSPPAPTLKWNAASVNSEGPIMAEPINDPASAVSPTHWQFHLSDQTVKEAGASAVAAPALIAARSRRGAEIAPARAPVPVRAAPRPAAFPATPGAAADSQTKWEFHVAPVSGLR